MKRKSLMAVVLFAAVSPNSYSAAAPASPPVREPAKPERPEPEKSAKPHKAAAKDDPTAAVTAAAKRLAEAARRELGEGFVVIEDAPFVLIGNLPAARMEAVRRDTVRRAAAGLWSAFFSKRPDEPIRLYLFADEKSYRAGARKLFGDEDVARFGYYRHSTRALLLDLSTGEGTLVHELTHALMAADFPEVPDWFNEGLASLFEQCRFEGGKIRGMVNWRLPLLKKAMAEKRLGSLADLFARKRGRFYGEGSSENYAQARYFCMFLQSKGVLPKFYRAFRDGAADDPTGTKFVLESLAAADLDAVERDFLKWVDGLAAER